MCSVIVAFNISVVVDTTINYLAEAEREKKRDFLIISVVVVVVKSFVVVRLIYFSLIWNCVARVRKMGGFTVDKLQVIRLRVDLSLFERGFWGLVQC